MTWLYPIHTTNTDQACEGLRVVMDTNQPSCLVIAPGRSVLNYGLYTGAKITAVALLRQDQYLPDISCIPPQYGTFNGMTGDINLGRPGGYLYLVWKSVQVE